MAELRHAAGNGQLDSEIVEAFIVLLERDTTALADDPDFETELEFERRVREMAEPRSTGSTSRPQQPAGRKRRRLIIGMRQRSANQG